MIHAFDGYLPQIGRDAYLVGQANLMGRITAAEELTIFPGAVIRGDIGKIQLGARVSIMELVSIHCDQAESICEIGNDCFIGRTALIYQSHIADGVRVGEGARIMPGVTIGANSIIVAGCALARGTEIPKNSLVQGVLGQSITPLPQKLLTRGKDCSEEARNVAKQYLEAASTPQPIEKGFISS